MHSLPDILLPPRSPSYSFSSPPPFCLFPFLFSSYYPHISKIMNSRGAAAFNGSPDSSSLPPPLPPPHDHGSHNHEAPTSDSEGGEAYGTRADDQPIANPLQPSSSTSSSYMSMRDQFSSTSSHDLEAAHPHPHPHHQQQAVQRSPIRGDTLLNLSVQAVLLTIQIQFQQNSSTTTTTTTTSERLPRAFGISVASFAFGFTSTLIGMFFRGVNAAAASVTEALGFLSTLFGFYSVMGIYLSQRFEGIIVWPLVVLLFLASASAYATFK